MKQTDSLPNDEVGRSLYVLSPLYGVLPLDFLFQSDTHDCPYLTGRKACEEAFSAAEFPPELYHDFMDHGFRRSGHYFYRPVCQDCAQCRSIRIPVSEYKPRKSHRRIMNKNRDIHVHIETPKLTRTKHRMYKDYLAVQHRTFTENSDTDLLRFLYDSPVNTLEIEYKLHDRIVAVGIVDLCSRSISSVYVYYDPDFAYRSLGTFSLLKEIMICREVGVPYYYLGYTVADCPSMNYKERFKPFELLDESFKWNRVPAKGRHINRNDQV
jgi:arginyl-tRNA--protein-N-Asp/Glu arginylyltransferase